MIKKRLFLLFICLSVTLTKIVAQDVLTMLNTISNVFNTRQETLYDEAEIYLNTLSKDSIEMNLETQILFHTDKAGLYLCKYKDWEKSNQEFDLILNKVKPVKHLPECNSLYKNLLSAYGYSLLNSGQTDKAISCFNNLLVENFDDELDVCIYNAYSALANLYTKKKETTLSEDCHNKCQEFLLKLYIREHPEHSFYFDNYKAIKDFTLQLERQNKNNTELYVNNLCSLGSLLHKIDQGKYWESFLILQKAHKCAIDNNLLKAKGLEECYVCLQDICIKHFPEPTKSKAIEELIPYMVDYFSGVLSPDDIYESIAASFGANEQYENAIEYELKVLNSIKKNTQNNKEKLQKIYKGLVMDYLGCRSDSANQIAFQYLQKFRNYISEKDTEQYEWFLENQGEILRYLHKNNEAIQSFKVNLVYFNNKYGKESDKYISTLNQLALCYPYDSDSYLSYLLRAKSLITKSKDISESTIRGISINLARNYILTGKTEQAKLELDNAVTIENKNFGRIFPLTQDLINQCKEQ